MSPTVLAAIRLYFRTFHRISPKRAGRQAYQLFRTPRWRRSVPSKAVSVMARAERFGVEVEGERMAAYRWRPAGVDNAPRVMLAHGWESRLARLAVWVDPLLDAGYEVVGFDGPAHGESEGRHADPRLFAATLRGVVEQTGPMTACIAHSMGAVAACLATVGGSLTDEENLPLDRLVVLAGAESGVDAMTMFSQVLGLGPKVLASILEAAAESAGRPLGAFDVHRQLGARPLPVLWFHDADDEIVPLAAAERVERACPHVRLERTRGLGHNDIARDPEIICRGLEFLAPASARSKTPGPSNPKVRPETDAAPPRLRSARRDGSPALHLEWQAQVPRKHVVDVVDA